MKRSTVYLAGLLLAGVLVQGAEKLDIKDPKPPKVHILGEVEELTAKPFDRLKFHKAPKPLPEGAVTEDWPRFLGASDNAISKETKLLKIIVNSASCGT